MMASLQLKRTLSLHHLSIFFIILIILIFELLLAELFYQVFIIIGTLIVINLIGILITTQLLQHTTIILTVN